MLDCEPLHHTKFLTHLQSTSSPIVGSSTVPASTFSVHFFEAVTSTNVEVWRLLEQGSGEGVVAIAQQQQSGRGQRGRTWQSPPGGLYLSLGLTPNFPISDSVRLTVGCAWGIATALRQRGIPVGVKWLNDLVLDGKKLGGILTETRIQQGQIQQAVLGFGLNWQNPVPELGVALGTWLQEQAHPAIASLEELGAIALQGAFAGYQTAKQEDINTLVACYESVLVNRGQIITLPASQSEEAIAGTVLGITTQGALRVQPLTTPTTEVFLEPGTIQLGYPTPLLPLA